MLLYHGNRGLISKSQETKYTNSIVPTHKSLSHQLSSLLLIAVATTYKQY